MEIAADPGWDCLDTRGRQVLQVHDRLSALLRAQAESGAGDFFAVPVLDADGRPLAWRSPHGGALQPATGPEWDAIFAERFRILRTVADRLEAHGDAGAIAAHMLRSALVVPRNAEAQFADGDRPVLVFWGMAAEGQARPAPPDTGGAAGPASRQARAFPALAWTIPLVLGAIGVWLGYAVAHPPPPRVIEMALPVLPAADPTEGLAERLAALDSALEETRATAPRYAAVCGAAADACIAGSSVPGEIMLVLDASSSMGYSINTPADLERQIIEASRKGDLATFDRLRRQAETYPGDARMRVAHKILSDTVVTAPGQTRIGLMSFHNCDSIRYAGNFAVDQRGSLLSRLRAVAPTNATALAQAIGEAARRVEGGLTPDDRVNMIIISDGMDSCGGDPCAAAQAAKRARPGLAISVVDLSNVRALACVAEATGGIYRQRDQQMDIASLSRAVREAAGTAGACPDTR